MFSWTSVSALVPDPVSSLGWFSGCGGGTVNGWLSANSTNFSVSSCGPMNPCDTRVQTQKEINEIISGIDKLVGCVGVCYQNRHHFRSGPRVDYSNMRQFIFSQRIHSHVVLPAISTWNLSLPEEYKRTIVSCFSNPSREVWPRCQNMNVVRNMDSTVSSLQVSLFNISDVNSRWLWILTSNQRPSAVAAERVYETMGLILSEIYGSLYAGLYMFDIQIKCN